MSDATARRLSFTESGWVVIALAFAMVPHAMRMPWWLSAISAALITWHLYVAHQRLAPPRRWVTALLVVGIAAAVYIQFRTLFGRDAGIALLTGMLALKLLEMRTAREGVLLLALDFFLVLTHFLFSQTMLTAAYLFVCVWLITAAMVRLQQRSAQPLSALRTSGILLAQSVPLMLALFVLFPRVQGPLWGLPGDAHTGLSGLSDTMTPGSVSNLILSDNIAFRARFGGPLPARDRLYWRGPVLTHFDGRTWTAGLLRHQREPVFDAEGQAQEYEVTLEPHNKRWLFALDLPGRVPPHAAATGDYQLISREPVTTRRRYDMASFLDYRAGVNESEFNRRRALQLPPDANPRTRAYARALRAQHADDETLVATVLRRFRDENFVYTLTPPPLDRHPADEFLFDTRAGFCEHYSSAFAVVMRAAGIPARIVTGYLGGELNPVGDYLIVRQADAHAWAEVWIRERGWVRVDPTAAVSPLRVERGISAAVDVAAGLPLFVRTDFELLRQFAFRWDMVAHTWNQWVLGYNPEQQRVVAQRLGLEASWRGLGVGLAAAAALLTVAVVLLMLWPRSRLRLDPVERGFRRCCALLARRGLARAPHEGALHYGVRVGGQRPALANDVRAVTRLYTELRYGCGGTADDRQAFERAVKRLLAAL